MKKRALKRFAGQIKPDERVRYGHISAVRSELKLSLLDMTWLMGVGNLWPTQDPEDQKDPISQPTQAILLRLYDALRKNLLPEMPSVQQVHEMAKTPYEAITGKELSVRRFGIILGASQFSSHRWAGPADGDGAGVGPGRGVERILLLLFHLLKTQKEDGMRLFLDIVDTEARTRGFPNGLEDIYKKGSWAWNQEAKDVKVRQAARRKERKKIKARGGNAVGTPFVVKKKKTAKKSPAKKKTRAKAGQRRKTGR